MSLSTGAAALVLEPSGQFLASFANDTDDPRSYPSGTWNFREVGPRQAVVILAEPSDQPHFVLVDFIDDATIDVQGLLPERPFLTLSRCEPFVDAQPRSSRDLPEIAVGDVVQNIAGTTWLDVGSSNPHAPQSIAFEATGTALLHFPRAVCEPDYRFSSFPAISVERLADQSCLKRAPYDPARFYRRGRYLVYGSRLYSRSDTFDSRRHIWLSFDGIEGIFTYTRPLLPSNRATIQLWPQSSSRRLAGTVVVSSPGSSQAPIATIAFDDTASLSNPAQREFSLQAPPVTPAVLQFSFVPADGRKTVSIVREID